MSVIPLTIAANHRKHSRRSASRLVPDMTAMVGLGFLLVTFFIMAGNFTKSSVMAMTVPARPTLGEPPAGCFFTNSHNVTLLLGKDHQIHYFFGENNPYDKRPRLYTTNFGPAGLRQVLLKAQQQDQRCTVLIKTTADAKYKDMVDVLDEMSITNTKKYALVDLASEDKELLTLNAL